MNPVNLERLFVAIPVPPEIKNAISSWIDQIKPHLPFRKWVHHEDLHITMQFLGDTPSGSISDINHVLQDIITVSSPLYLRVGSLGFFGRSTQPSVLWASVGGDIEGLHHLHKRITEALTPLGFSPEERKFHPHLTLARNFIGSTPFDTYKLSTFTLSNPSLENLLSWKSNRIILYRSHLNKRPMYEAILR